MIKRVYGKADSFDLIFIENGGIWIVSVPADLEDGRYVVELFAEDNFGFTSFYTGILYMFDGKAAFEMNDDDIYIGLHKEDFFVQISCDKEIDLKDDELILVFIDYDTVGGWI